MRRFSEIFLGFLLGFASLLMIFLLSSDVAAHFEICETGKEGANECARYGVIGLAFHLLGRFLKEYDGLITAIATIAIAWFTLSLSADLPTSSGTQVSDNFPICDRVPNISSELMCTSRRHPFD